MTGRAADVLRWRPDVVAALGVLAAVPGLSADQDRAGRARGLARWLAAAPTPWTLPTARQAERILASFGGPRAVGSLWRRATALVPHLRQHPEVWEGAQADVRLIVQGRRAGQPDPVDHLLRAALGVKAISIEDAGLAAAPRWNWPLVVGFGASSDAVALRSQIESNQYYRDTFQGAVPQTRHVGLGDDAASCELALVTSNAGAVRLGSSRNLRASVIIALGTVVDPVAVRGAARATGASGWALVPSPDLAWSADWFIHMCVWLSHDSPLDKAFARASLAAAAGRGAEAPEIHLAAHADLVRGARISAVLAHIHRRAREMALPDLADAAESAVADVRFDREVNGSQTTAELNETLTAAEPAEPDRSSLQAQVFGPGDIRRRHTFQANAVNTVKVRIGPGDADWISSNVPFPTEGLSVDERTGQAKITLVVVVGGEEPQRVDTWLSVAHPVMSSTKSFDVVAGAAGDRLAIDVLAFHEGRLLQQSVIEGAIANSDDGDQLLSFRPVLVARTALEDLAERTSFDLAFGTDAAGRVLVHGGQATISLDPVRLRPLAQDLEALFTQASRTPTPWPAAQQRDFWRTLADHGRQLRQELRHAAIDGLETATRVQIAGGGAVDVLPLEVVYVGGQPTAGAKQCPGWEAALTEGSCPACPAGPQPIDMPTETICPLHFWGLSRVIERCVAGPGEAMGAVRLSEPVSGRRHLRPFDQVLFGVSDLVSGDLSAGPLLETSITTIKGRGLTLRSTRTWRTWCRRVREDRPALLVAIAHNAVQDVPRRRRNAGNRLEIGAGDGLPYTRITRAHVSTDDADGPVVLLLGCNTVDVVSPYQGFTAEFSENGAAVVVGVLAEVWVGDAPVAAAEFVQHLVGERWAADSTFGDVMLSVRRDLVSSGHPIAMAFAAYGDADWLLPERTE